MPIRTAVPIIVFEQERYHAVDRQVTGLAFDIHNEFGRYLDEKLYQRELVRRCRVAGVDAIPEMRISVSLGDFCKEYCVDLLLEQGVVVEIKTAAALCPAHRGQTLNYLFMCGLSHATLLNFRTERVQHEFVSTRLTSEARRRYDFDLRHWQPLGLQDTRLHEVLREVLADWGAFLDPLLYRDALSYFLKVTPREINVHSNGESIGSQSMHMLTDDIAFSVTASTHRPESVLDHQRRFLDHTSLRAIQWINLNHHQIELRTITKNA